MSNSERRNSRKSEHPRTLTFRDQAYTQPTDDVYSYMTSENTSYFGSSCGVFPTNITKYRWTSIQSDGIMCLGILKYGFEEEVYDYREGECDNESPWDSCHDNGTNTFEDESDYKFFYFVGTRKDDSWHFDLHVYSSLQPIICHAMTQHEYDLYYTETYGVCYDCGGEIGYMSGQCADCFWEEDYKRKHRRSSFYCNNPDLQSAWQSHCRHVLYPNEEIVVSELLCKHIPTAVPKETPEYQAYLDRFKTAIVSGMPAVINLLTDINPEYTPNDE